MTKKQQMVVTANMNSQLVYHQQMIGHLVGLVHGLKGVLIEIAANQGISERDLERRFADATRKTTHTLAEIPFPKLTWPEDETSFDPTSE